MGLAYKLVVCNLLIIIQGTEIRVTDEGNVCILLTNFCLKLCIGLLLLTALAEYNEFQTLLRH